MSIQIQLHGFHGPKSKGTSHPVISEETIYLQREMRNALDKVQGMLENSSAVYVGKLYKKINSKL